MNKTPEKIENFSENLAPFLIGNEFAKKIVSLQFFCNPLVEEEKMHVMLLGDFGSAKTKFLLEITDINSVSIYCADKTTPNGLYQDANSADGGILALDEIFKQDELVLKMLYDFMQTGMVHISRDKESGGHEDLMARTCVIAAGNPHGNGKLSKNVPILSQIPPDFAMPILSRFHLIIPFYEAPITAYRDIAIAMGKKNLKSDGERKEFLRDYVNYVKEKFHNVTIPEEIEGDAGEYIGRLKKISPLRLMITPRAIEGFRSCLKARSRMEWKNEVDYDDFEYVKQIYESLYMNKKME